MLSGWRDDRQRGPLFWAFVASVMLHGLLAPLYGWTWFARIAPPVPIRRETVVASTAVRIERHPIPLPRSVAAPRPAISRVDRPQRAVRSALPAPKAAAPRHELARVIAQATPQPQPTQERTPDVASAAPTAFARQLAEQERSFDQEARQFRTQNAPLSLASPTHRAAQTFHRSYFDVPGHIDKQPVQMQLIPLRHWLAGTAICYYARYVAQFASGASEDGTIPWPVCYPANDDRIANPPYVHDVPLPLPPFGYTLPSGTYLTPLLARIYAGRDGAR